MLTIVTTNGMCVPWKGKIMFWKKKIPAGFRLSNFSHLLSAGYAAMRDATTEDDLRKHLRAVRSLIDEAIYEAIQLPNIEKRIIMTRLLYSLDGIVEVNRQMPNWLDNFKKGNDFFFEASLKVD